MSADPINRADWLHDQAQPASLLLSAATMQLEQATISRVEPSAIRIPGHVHPILAYQICGLDGSDESRVL
jgi:hypothetical protein